MCLQGYLLSRPIDGDAVLATVAAMPERFQSLFLETSPATAMEEASRQISSNEPAPFLFEFGSSEPA